MTATCDELRRRLDPDAPVCSSSCHDPARAGGRYCAPARCYCGGCPAFVPVERAGGPVTVEQSAERRQLAVDDARRQLAAATVRTRIELLAEGEPVTFAAGGLVAA